MLGPRMPHSSLKNRLFHIARSIWEQNLTIQFARTPLVKACKEEEALIVFSYKLSGRLMNNPHRPPALAISSCDLSNCWKQESLHEILRAEHFRDFASTHEMLITQIQIPDE